MKIRDLIAELEQHHPDSEVMIRDGGCPREINVGPFGCEITAEDAGDCADCEGREGEWVVVIGFGSY